MSEKELILRIKAAMDASGFDKIKDHIRSIGDVAVKAGQIAAAGVAVAAGAAVGIGVAWFSAAADASQAVDQLQASLGTTEAQAAHLAQVGRDVWANNWAGSIQEATAAVGQFTQAFQHDATPEQLQQATEAAFALRDALGVDLEKSGRIATNMFTTFGLEGAASMDIVAAGLQRAGPAGEDFADSLLEYSDHFNRLGFSATQMGDMLVAAVQAGAWNTDVAGDAIKEFGIRISDGTLLSKAALETLPASVTSVASAFNDGAITGEQAFQQIIGAIAEIDDPMLRYQAGVMAFGTKWEDVGEAAMLAMADSQGALGDAEGAALAAGNAINQNIGSAWESVKRTALSTLLDIGGSDAFAGLEQTAVSALGEVQTRLGEFGTSIMTAGEWSSSFGETVTTSLGGLLGIDLSGLTGMIDDLKQRWDDAVVAFQNEGIVEGLSTLVGFDLQPLIDTVLTLGGAVVDLGGFLLEHKGFVLLAAGAYLAFKSAIAINKQVEAAKIVLSGMKAVWLAYKAGTLGATLATTGFGAALKLAMGPIGWIITAVGLLGLAWSTNFLGIRDKAQPVIDWIKGLPAAIGGALASIPEAVGGLIREWSAKWNSLSDGTKAAVRGLLMIFFPIPMLFTQTGRNMIMGLWNGIKAIWAQVVGWLKSAADKLPDPVKKALRMASPSRVFYQLGLWVMEGWALGLRAGGKLARAAMDDALGAVLAFDQSGQLDAARQHIRDVGNEIMAARNEFLSGGAGEAGSLAWMLSEGRLAVPDWGSFFDGIAIPVGDVAAFQELLEWLVSEGEYEEAQRLWERFFDAIKAQAEDAHQQRLRHIDDEAKARAADFEITKRRISELIADRERQAKESGWPETPKIEGMGDEIAAITSRYADVLEELGFRGSDALHRFYEAMTRGAVSNITTNEDLTKALDLLGAAVGKHYEDWKQRETDNHETAMAYLSERAAAIGHLLENQKLAEEEFEALRARREELLAEAREAVKASQEAAEKYETRVHEGVMRQIASQRQAWTKLHNERMSALERQRQSQEDFHAAIIQSLQDQRAKIGEEFTAREKAIDQMRARLDQLKIDLRVEDALAELVRLKDELGEIQRIMGTFQVQARGREHLEQQRKAQTERVRATTDEQRAILERARDSGLLSQDQLRTVQMLLLGYKQRATDVAEIFAIVEQSLKDQVDKQQEVVDSNQRQIDALARQIEFAETILSIDKTRAQVQIDAIEAQIKAEELRWKTESGRLDSAIAAEKSRFEAQMAYLDEVEQRENDRHAQRMADIAAEHALMLAGLGMSQEEISGIIAAAQALAQSIADETKALFDRILAEAPDPGAIIGIGADDPELTKRIRPPRGEEPPPGIGGGEGGRGGGGLRPKGEVVIDGGALVSEGTIEHVDLGGVHSETYVTVRIDGRDIAAEVVDAIVGNVTITDKLGRALNERGAQRTP